MEPVGWQKWTTKQNEPTNAYACTYESNEPTTQTNDINKHSVMGIRGDSLYTVFLGKMQIAIAIVANNEKSLAIKHLTRWLWPHYQTSGDKSTIYDATGNVEWPRLLPLAVSQFQFHFLSLPHSCVCHLFSLSAPRPHSFSRQPQKVI